MRHLNIPATSWYCVQETVDLFKQKPSYIPAFILQFSIKQTDESCNEIIKLGYLKAVYLIYKMGTPSWVIPVASLSAICIIGFVGIWVW